MTGSVKHVNIPVFIPHLGCPNQCVFCDQRTISGTLSFVESDAWEGVDRVISALSEKRRGENSDAFDNGGRAKGEIECEIAFFGGSFTGIDRDLMLRLLTKAESYVSRGEVSGIRMSTRPDYIDGEVIRILKDFTVKEVELGIQSMSDRVLAASRRGHTANDSRRAVEMLLREGFSVGGQMMVGLPTSKREDEVNTAREIARLGCASARIYPTVVFGGCELNEMMHRGEYLPLSDEEAVERSCDALEVFLKNGVKVLRIGLCDSEDLHSSSYGAGPNDPAIGERVVSRYYLRKIMSYLEDHPDGEAIRVFCAPGETSKISGNRRENKKILQSRGIKTLKIVESPEILRYNIKIGEVSVPN